MYHRNPCQTREIIIRLKLESKPNLCADCSCKSLISYLLPTDLCLVEYISVLATESSFLYKVHVFKQQHKEVILTVIILSFRTDSSVQTVLTQIRLLLEEQSDQGLHCLPFRLHLLDALLYRQPLCSNFRVITANFSGVQIFKNFTVHVSFYKIRHK